MATQCYVTARDHAQYFGGRTVKTIQPDASPTPAYTGRERRLRGPYDRRLNTRLEGRRYRQWDRRKAVGR